MDKFPIYCVWAVAAILVSLNLTTCDITIKIEDLQQIKEILNG